MTKRLTVLDVNPDTGEIYRVLRSGERRVAGYVDERRGYRYVSVNNRERGAHQIVWEHVHGKVPDDFEIDHIDGNPSNNAITNLRLVTHSQNMQNQHRPRSNNKTSGIKGVHWCSSRGKWRTHIVVQGRQIFLGRFSTVQEAANAYAKAAAIFHTHNPSARAHDDAARN